MRPWLYSEGQNCRPPQQTCRSQNTHKSKKGQKLNAKFAPAHTEGHLDSASGRRIRIHRELRLRISLLVPISSVRTCAFRYPACRPAFSFRQKQTKTGQRRVSLQHTTLSAK